MKGLLEQAAGVLTTSLALGNFALFDQLFDLLLRHHRSSSLFFRRI
jgi:hypothetical protein